MGAGELIFGPFLLDPSRGTLLQAGKPVAIGQRGLALLMALAEIDGPVSKAALMEAGWPGTAVEEGNLTVQIAALRKALGPREDGHDWIVTVPRVGYRLLHTDVSPAGDARLPSLAVMPFQNMSGDSEQEYFADGVVEDIITALSRFRSFAVIARNSSFVYKGRAVDVREVSRELSVRYVLEGSVRRSGNRLRVTAQLVDCESGAHLWAQTFDGLLDDVFEVQDRITESVASLVAPQIKGAEIERARRSASRSVAVYDLYLRALPLLDSFAEADNREGLRRLLEALALDPDNAQMLAHAAETFGHRHEMGWTPYGPDDLQKCAEFARRALQLAAGNPRTMARCAVALIMTVRDYDLGYEVATTAAQANPNDLFAVTVAGVAELHCGDLDRAIALFTRALRLSGGGPDSQLALTFIAHACVVRGAYAEALDHGTRSLMFNSHFDPTYWFLIAALAHLGRIDEARGYLATLLAEKPGVTLAGIRAGQPARLPQRIEPVLAGLRLAGMPERSDG